MKFIRSRIFLNSIFLAFVFWVVWFSTQVRAFQQQSQPLGETTEKVFASYQTDRGVVSRELSKAEAARIFLPLAGESAPISVVVASANQSLLRFMLTSTAQLDASPQAKAAVQRVLTRWAESFDNELNVPVRVDFAPTLFGNPFPSPEAVAVTAVSLYGARYQFLPELLRARTFSAQQLALYDNFPNDTFHSEIRQASSIHIPVPLAKVTGALVAGFNDPFTIGFNSTLKYDFDPRDGIDADKLDFEALMAREVGRALGFISNAGAAELRFETQPDANSQQLETLWDIFRFRDRVSLDEFSDATRAQLADGKHVFFAGGELLPLSTGKPDGQGGDGRPAGHWKDDELTGQYLGIMDPTYAPGERGGITVNDLSALDFLGFSVRANTPVMEVLSNDDNFGEENLSLNGALTVVRFSLSRYPAEVQAVRLRLPQTIAATGQQIRIVVFADPARSGHPPSNPTFLMDRTMLISAVPENRMLELMLPNVLNIESGDFYVGLQASAGLTLVGDANVAQPRSFVSLDNGASFQALKGANQQPVNLMLRAVVMAKYGAPAIPEITALSPNAIIPNGQNFRLTVYGKNFFGIKGDGFRESSIVFWNGREQQTDFIHGSMLVATIPETEIAPSGSASIVVKTRTESSEVLESAAVELAIGEQRPAPSLELLSPPSAAQGGEAFSLAILGRNFSRESVVRWNGVERISSFYNSTELSLPVTKNDLANAANVEVSVVTPGPGGGESDKFLFPIAPCQYRLSAGDQAFSPFGIVREVFVFTRSYCRWSAQSNAVWLGLSGQTGRIGSGLFSIDIESNFADSGRVGTVTVSDERFNVRQSGFAKSVSAASFSAPIAPESMASVFSLGHGSGTFVTSGVALPAQLGGVEVRVRSALGAERVAPLFFVSPEQINFQVPAGVATGTATVFVYHNGLYRNYGPVQITQFAPGIFTTNAAGTGLASAVALRVKADGSQNFESLAVFDPSQNRIVARPIDLGGENDRVFLVLFGTGWRGRTDLSAFRVRVGGMDAPVTFAGAQGEFTGLDQMNVEIPFSLRGRGEVTINCTVDGRVANPVTVTIK